MELKRGDKKDSRGHAQPNTGSRATMDQEGIDPLFLLLMLAPIGSLAGCAALLRSGQALSKRAFWTAILNSGLMATAIASGMFWHFGTDEAWLVISVSIFAGLGGTAAIDFMLALLISWVKNKTGNGK